MEKEGTMKEEMNDVSKEKETLERELKENARNLKNHNVNEKCL